jgi:CRP-like cAMP-binding protein
LCKYLSDEQLLQLEKVVDIKRFEPGSTVVSAGSKPDSIYVLAEGELTLKEAKTNTTMAKIYAGEMSCELHYVIDHPAPYTIMATKASTLNSIPFARLDELCTNDADFGAKIQASVGDSLCLKIIRLTHKRH